MEEKFKKAFESMPPVKGKDDISSDIDRILNQHFVENNNAKVLRDLYSFIDLTTLTARDNQTSVRELVHGVNQRSEIYGDRLPSVAAICVYPAFVGTVKKALKVPSVHVASVSGGFPASQTLLDIKVIETSLAVREGADEIDIVLNIGAFLDGDYRAVVEEIEEQIAHANGAILKIILETGALVEPELIHQASVLSLFSGVNFLKTSTGKEYPGATLEAAYVILQTLRDYYQIFGRKVGFKVSGGVSSPEDAVKYYTLVKTILGEEWLNPQLFRIGTSSLERKLREKILA